MRYAIQLYNTLFTYTYIVACFSIHHRNMGLISVLAGRFPGAWLQLNGFGDRL